MASQFHPEFKSRPDRPHPLFDGFIASAIAVAEGRQPELGVRVTARPAETPAGDAAPVAVPMAEADPVDETAPSQA